MGEGVGGKLVMVGEEDDMFDGGMGHLSTDGTLPNYGNGYGRLGCISFEGIMILPFVAMRFVLLTSRWFLTCDLIPYLVVSRNLLYNALVLPNTQISARA